MRASAYNVLYVLECGATLMDKIRRTASYWAEGDENICLTAEQAAEIEELSGIMGQHPNFDGDVIVSC